MISENDFITGFGSWSGNPVMMNCMKEFMNNSSDRIKSVNIDSLNIEMGNISINNDSIVGFDDLMSMFNEKEALRIAYIPIILTQTGFLYAEYVVSLCKAYKLPFRNQTSIISKAINEYRSNYIKPNRDYTIEKLESMFDEFMEIVDDDINILQYTAKNSMLNKYNMPNKKVENMVMNACCCMAILKYVIELERKTDSLILERINRKRDRFKGESIFNVMHDNPFIESTINSCNSIISHYGIKYLDFAKTCVKVLSNRIDKIIDTMIEEDGTKGKP